MPRMNKVVNKARHVAKWFTNLTPHERKVFDAVLACALRTAEAGSGAVREKTVREKAVREKLATGRFCRVLFKINLQTALE